MRKITVHVTEKIARTFDECWKAMNEWNGKKVRVDEGRKDRNMNERWCERWRGRERRAMFEEAMPRQQQKYLAKNFGCAWFKNISKKFNIEKSLYFLHFHNINFY